MTPRLFAFPSPADNDDVFMTRSARLGDFLLLQPKTSQEDIRSMTLPTFGALMNAGCGRRIPSTKTTVSKISCRFALRCLHQQRQIHRTFSTTQKKPSNNDGKDSDIDATTIQDDQSTSEPVDDSAAPRVITTLDSQTGICHVQWNRQNKLNAVDMKMFEAIAETATTLQQEKSLRAVILSGKGRAFCTGLDVKAVLASAGTSQGPVKQMERLLERPSGYGSKGIGNLAQDVAMLWRELPVPVIAVVHGMCYGAGLQIALGADFRISTHDCKWSVMEGKWGLIPDMGASVLLKEAVGRMDVCKELTMTGRIVSGSEAGELGLVTRVCGEDDDPMEEAMALAKVLVERSPDALAATKELYQNTWTMDEGDALKEETRLQRKLLISWNQIAASGRSALGWKIPYFNRKE